MSGKQKIVAIVYNTCHYIYLFRLNLIKSLQGQGFRVIAIAPHDEFTTLLEKEGIECVNIHIDQKGLNPIRDLKLVLDLRSCYKQIKPNVLLHFTIKPNIYGSLAALSLRLDSINNITGLGTVFIGTNRLLKIVTSMAYRISFIGAYRVFFQNEYDRDFFVQKRIVQKEKSRLLPGSGVDTEKYCPSDRDSTNDSVFKFLMISRLIADKGVYEFVEAARRVREVLPEVQFQLLGQLGTQNRTAISGEELKSWEDEGLIDYLGSTNDVRVFIANAACIVLPSYREGTSKTLLEAASMAKPLIATNVPGCNNVVVDGLNGYLCEAKSGEDLANCMIKLVLLDQDSRKAMGRRGREIMVERFDEGIVIDQYLKAVSELTKEAAKA